MVIKINEWIQQFAGILVAMIVSTMLSAVITIHVLNVEIKNMEASLVHEQHSISRLRKEIFIIVLDKERHEKAIYRSFLNKNNRLAPKPTSYKDPPPSGGSR